MPAKMTGVSPRRTSAAEPGTRKPPGPAKAQRASRRATAPQRPVTQDATRREMIAQAAYYLAERRGFAAGDPLQDWLQAEAEIDRTTPR